VQTKLEEINVKEDFTNVKTDKKKEIPRVKMEPKTDEKKETKVEASTRLSRYANERIVSSQSPKAAVAEAAGVEDFTLKEIIQVELQKRAVGLGFCIEGGKGSPLGDKPITVKRLYKGDAAAHGVLKAGDEIITCNEKDFTPLSHFHAWNFLKALPEGPVKLTLRRKAVL